MSVNPGNWHENGKVGECEVAGRGKVRTVQVSLPLISDTLYYVLG